MGPATPNLSSARQSNPSSPPETPIDSNFDYDNISPKTRTSQYYGIFNSSRHTFPQAVSVQGVDFAYSPSMHLEDFSPRSSSPSSDSSGSPPRSVSSEPLVAENDRPESVPLMRSRRVSNGNFTIEELHENHMRTVSDDALSVIRPDQYEDAESEGAFSNQARRNSADTTSRSLAEKLKYLSCEPTIADHEAWVQQQRARKRRNRLSSGSIHKRTLSQSLGSDTDEEDLQFFEPNEAGSSARRLKRKVAGERTSLIFDDPPQRIVECDENESNDTSNAVVHDAETEDVADVDDELLHALPYYKDSSSMDIESAEEWRDDRSI